MGGDYIVCDGCGRQLNPKSDTVFQAVSGWVKLRSAGGANALTQRVGHPRFRCKGCIEVLNPGHDFQQEALF